MRRYTVPSMMPDLKCLINFNLCHPVCPVAPGTPGFVSLSNQVLVIDHALPPTDLEIAEARVHVETAATPWPCQSHGLRGNAVGVTGKHGRLAHVVEAKVQEYYPLQSDTCRIGVRWVEGSVTCE